MSRTFKDDKYKKIYFTDSKNNKKYFKRQANKKVRKSESDNGTNFKKFYESYNINDYKFKHFERINNKKYIKE